MFGHFTSACRCRRGEKHASCRFGGHRFRPIVELLETRTTPTTFRWINFLGDNVWEAPQNWFSEVENPNDYPGFNGTAVTTNDVAEFRGNLSDTDVIMATPKELGSLITSNNYSKNIRLQAQLTLNSGGQHGTGNIVQKTATENGPIILTDGTFTWSGGNINYSPDFATTNGSFTINGAIATFAQPANAPGKFGSDLTVMGGSILRLGNAGTITLVNRPHIENLGGIEVITDNNAGLVVATGDPGLTILNHGDFTKTTGNTSYVIDNPIKSLDGGLVWVQSGTLRFKMADATSDYSVTQAPGTIQLEPGTTLYADAGVKQESGLILASGGGRAFITNSTNDVRITGGTIDVAASTGILQIDGNLRFEAGTMQFTYDTVAGSGGLVESRGNTGITITRNSTTVAVTFVGGGNLPQSLDVMRAIVGTISDVCGTNPAGYTAILAQTVRANDTYRLQQDDPPPPPPPVENGPIRGKRILSSAGKEEKGGQFATNANNVRIQNVLSPPLLVSEVTDPCFAAFEDWFEAPPVDLASTFDEMSPAA
ncbi:MAG: hypothetical protein L0Y72_13170 [Gemmataceae bacterium]|nr:hypothetical protein [Gemmataceae bacterium]